MNLAHIDLDNLSISAANMRHGRRPPDISDLLPSVRARGILMPLLVRANGSTSTYEIVAGRRRYFAARAVKDEGGEVAPVPCHIMGPGDDASALEASLIENIHRRDADEMSQYEAFSRLMRKGKGVDEIATTFGLSKRAVTQRLALGNLLPKIREAYRREDIDAETVQHLTLATKSQQKAWLAMYESEDNNTPFGSDIKHWLFGGRSIPTGVALFPVETYPGQVIADLFGEDSYFSDTEAFWQKQNEAIAARRDSYLAAGWKDVSVLEPGKHFAIWEHEQRAKTKGGKVFVEVSLQGEVTFHEGYIARKEARKKMQDEAGGESEIRPAPKPEVTSAMQAYIDFHRHAAVRASLIDHPTVALRLMIAHAIGASRLWDVKPEQRVSGRAETDKSVENSVSHKAFEARRIEVLSLLGLPEGCGLVAGRAEETATFFVRLLALSDAEVMRVLAVVMAESLDAGSEMVEATGVHLQVDMKACWHPDEAFIDLLRDKSILSLMIAEIAGKAVADGNIAATTKVQKAIIRDCLNGTNGRVKIAGWLPRWMEFPVRSYRKDSEFRATRI